jgi:hypothetical protein
VADLRPQAWLIRPELDVDDRPARALALHTGDAHVRDDGRYTGPVLRRAERLREIANGGQSLLTARTAELVGDALPPGAAMRDLGLHRLRDLSNPERVFELLGGDDVDASPPLRSRDASPNNLPVQLTTFVGREAELAAVGDLLAAERLVTLHGAGDSGKTRLAAQVAAEQAARRRDGAWWVELDAATDPASVAELVAAELGVLVEPVQGRCAPSPSACATGSCCCASTTASTCSTSSPRSPAPCCAAAPR